MKIVFSIVILIIISSAAATRISKVSKELENSQTFISKPEPKKKVIVAEPKTKVIVAEPKTKVIVAEPKKKVSEAEPKKRIGGFEIPFLSKADTWADTLKVKVEVELRRFKSDWSSFINVTTVPKKADKGLLFSADLAGLDLGITKAEKEIFFVTSDKDSTKTLIPFRKITNCEPENNKSGLKYETIKISNDLEPTKEYFFLTYWIKLQNDYYKLSAAPLSKPEDQNKFCNNIMKHAKEAQDAVRVEKKAIMDAANNWVTNTNKKLKEKAAANVVSINDHIAALKNDNAGMNGVLAPLEDTVNSLSSLVFNELDSKKWVAKVQTNLDSIFPK